MNGEEDITITDNHKIQKKIRYFLLLLFISFTVYPLLSFGSSKPSDAYDRSGTCISCHVMEAQYEAWMHSGAHRRKACADCHLPNENLFVHYLWKSIDGLKDLVIFHSGRISEQIKISSHGQEVLQSNCIRCHETTVMMIDTERKCWNCHKRISHIHTGIRETL
jgi:cytochrome c nitrite reductase small subunit